MSKGLKIMSLGVINHGMSLSVLYILVEKVVKKILSHGNEEVRLIKFYCPFCGESFGMLDVSFLKE
jgi:hypothetical protein